MDAPPIRPGEVVGEALGRADALPRAGGLPAPGKHGWTRLPYRDR